MRRALLLYNPQSGRRHRARIEHVEAAADQFREAGVEAICEPIVGPGTAAYQAEAAIMSGCDTIIVCGGDGSIHETLPALVGAPAALGVIPLGTGNGLAADLGLPHNPAAAARMLAKSEPRTIALPTIDFQRAGGRRDCRLFIIGAGMGPDAEMIYALTLRFKHRWGMAAYYTEATRQWLTHPLSMFTVEFRDVQGNLRRERISQALAVRITRFGGMVGRLTPSAALHRNDFALLLFKTRSRTRFLQYMIGVWLDRHWPVHDVEIVHATEARAFLEPGDEKPGARVYVEADGELLGTLPAAVNMTSETIHLLVPPAALRR